MKTYRVTAHNVNNKAFHMSYTAHSTGHAGAQFIADMKERNLSVVSIRATGEVNYLSSDEFDEFVILDRIKLVK